MSCILKKSELRNIIKEELDKILVPRRSKEERAKKGSKVFAATFDNIKTYIYELIYQDRLDGEFEDLNTHGWYENELPERIEDEFGPIPYALAGKLEKYIRDQID